MNTLSIRSTNLSWTMMSNEIYPFYWTYEQNIKSPLWALRLEDGKMNDKEKLIEQVNKMMAGADYKDIRLVYIAVREILSK